MASKDIEKGLNGLESNTLSWTSVNYIAKVKGADKLILQDVHGSISSGRLLAVMGPSGAGKSTFLDSLAGRKISGFSGSVSFNNQQDFAVSDVASYVEQDDALLGALTVKETLSYAARLHAVSDKRVDHAQRVQDTIAMLGLSGVQNSIIGNVLQRGISGGQKRRVTVGTSVVAQPKVLFLDEPTSGLDSTAAFNVMSSIKELAIKKDMIVIATIHQPNFEILSLFDDLLILARGKAIYQGPVLEMADYFRPLGYNCPAYVNPADYVINLVNDDFELDPTLVRERTDAFAKALASKHPSTAISGSATSQSFEITTHKPSPVVQLLKQTYILSERSAITYSRNLLAYGVRVGMYLGMGVMLAIIWLNIGTDQARINDRLSVHFFSVAFLSFMSVAGIPSFLEERQVFLRERANNLYGPAAYVAANSLVNAPFLAICVVLFSVVAYWSIGLHAGAGYFFKFMTFVFIGVYAAESQSVLVAAVIPIFVAALAVAAFLNGFWMSVQGYFNRNLPAFWEKSFHYMDYQTYAFQLLVNNDMTGLTFTCGEPDSNSQCKCMYQGIVQADGQCGFRGETVLQSLGFEGINYGHWIGIMIAIIVIYRFLFYVALRMRH